MHSPVLSTIAQMLFESTTTLNYARIVAEMEQVLNRLKGDQLVTTWDCDDLVFFDLSETRIALGFSEFVGASVASCLTVSVGPRPGATDLPLDSGFDVLCSRIVERLQARFLPLAVLWNQTEEEITSDLIDALTDSLPTLEVGLPPIDGLVGSLWKTADAAEAVAGQMRRVHKSSDDAQLAEAAPAAQAALETPVPVAPAPPADPAASRRTATIALLQRPAAAPSLAANDMPTSTLRSSEELQRLRAALYQDAPAAKPDAPISTQMRLAVHAMNATLIMVWMPLGAALMTYSILKGEDMRVSGRIMALTGTFLALAHSPLAHSVAAVVTGT